MKKISISLLTLFFSIPLFSQSPRSIAIIPEPVSVKATNATFTLPKAVVIEAGPQQELKQTIDFLKQRLSIPTGSVVTVSNSAPKATIALILNRTTDAAVGQEGYRLSVTAKKISVSANEPEGLFYGVQSLVQLFPPEIESATVVRNIKWEAPTVEIMDYPRFEWRGLMFDVSRHFFTKAEVKQFIDQMVRYKFNLLHMHLTDDEGWRIQIKAYPRLTEVGAWNVKKIGYF